MPSTSRLVRAVRHHGLPRSARVGLLRIELERRLRARTEYALRLGPTTIYLSHADYEIDWASLAFVAVDDAYAGDYGGAVVVDIGAHKGYYGAYAFLRGARTVVSYEPETANFALLARGADSAPEASWQTWQQAVGVRSGEVDLHLMGASWGHAFHPPEAFARYERGVQRVRVEALADVLATATGLAGGGRLIVKVNIEGEECATILGTPPAAWRRVGTAYVETHPWADCGADDLAGHLEAAGLTRRESAHPAVLRLERE